MLSRRMRLKTERGCAPPSDREPEHRVKEGGSQWRWRGRLVDQGLEGNSIKVIEQQAVTVVIDKRSKIS